MKIVKKPSDNFQNNCITDPENEKVENLTNQVKEILPAPGQQPITPPPGGVMRQSRN
jgi:hypothetical protein